MKRIGGRFEDKDTHALYRVKWKNDWLVLLEKEDGTAQIMTTFYILKVFYEQLDDKGSPGPSKKAISVFPC